MYYFYVIYQPPSSGQENFDLLCELVDNAEKNSIMVGDFNLPNIDWSSGEARGREAKFVTVLQDNYMEQLVDFKTHIKGNCLDLLITNIPGKVKEVCEMGRLGKSDHIIMQISLALAEQRESEPVVTKNWKRADWQKVRAGLSETIWPRTDDDLSAQEAWRKLRDTLDTLGEENVPKCSFRPRRTEWMSGEILREVRRKRRLWKTAKKRSGQRRIRPGSQESKKPHQKGKKKHGEEASGGQISEQQTILQLCEEENYIQGCSRPPSSTSRGT